MQVLDKAPRDLFKCVKPDANGMHYSVAVLHSRKEVDLCIEQLNGTQLADTTITVTDDTEDHKELDSYLKGQSEWIKMTNLCPTTSEQDILSLIAQHPQITAEPVTIMLRHHSKSSQNPNDRDIVTADTAAEWPIYAYIECVSPQQATSMVEHLNMTTLNGRPLWVTWIFWEEPDRGHQHCKHSDTANIKKDATVFAKRAVELIYVHHTVTAKALRTLCSEHGVVEKVRWFHWNGYFSNRVRGRVL